MSSRGAFGAPNPKHKSQNVNSVYSGKNTAASKASGPSKHGGLQALGRTTTIVRRMPKPATLPSLKAEHGQDPHVCLVPQGSQGWSKSSAEQPNNADSKTTDVNALSASANGPDLRPNWAKQGSPVGTPPACALSAPGGGGPDGSATQQSSTGGGGGEYPTLAASMKFGSSAGVGEESLVELPNVIPPQPAGYIGASGPRVSDRKLPSRYYGGPESAGPCSATGQKKYDFMQKMAKLSLDSNKDAPAATHASSEEADVVGKAVHPAGQPPTEKLPKQPSESGESRQAHPYAHQQQPEYDRQRLSASESTTDSSALHNKHRPSSFDGFKGGGAEPEDAYHHPQHPPHHGVHPKQLLLKHNVDSSLPSGERQSGRGDTGFTSQSSDIQQHQNSPFAGRHAPAGRDGYDGVGGGGSVYRYGHSGSFHHSETGGYENNDEQLYRGSHRPPAGGYAHKEATGWGDELTGKTTHQRPTRQPLLSQPQAQPQQQQQQQQQQMHYRVDSRHTNNSDSDGSGWNASIGNFPVPAGRRSGSANANGYPAQHQSTGWYGGGNGGSGYPPSLMSLETGVIDAAYDGRYNRQQPGYGGCYGGSVPRNGPVTSAYAPSAIDEQQFSGESHGSSKGRQAIGAELSSASEGDATTHGYLSNDFFGRDHGGEFDNEKGLWERSYSGEPPYNKRPSELQHHPPIRMLKRNDEKSAEYFAYYATPNPTGQSDASDTLANTGTDTNNDLPLYSNVKKPLLPHKSKSSDETDAFETTGGYREFHRHESQSGSYNKKNTAEATGQSFGGDSNNGSVQPDAQHNQQKFNRAPGGGKLQQGTQQQSQAQLRNGAKHDATSQGKTAATGSTVAVPPENVWEKRKEERLQAERKGLTARQRRQLDQHFPPMSEAAKIEAAANEAPPASVNSSFIRDIPRNQDVRLEQKGGFGGLATTSGPARGFPQWNPPALGAKSHWDEALKPTANGERRGTNRRNNGQPSRGTDAPELSSNYGTRREFVNSKNRGGAGAIAVGSGNASGRGLRGNKQRGGASLSSTAGCSGDVRQPRQGGEGTSVLLPKTSGDVTDQQLLKTPNDVEQDNFSNMGEFHAEDYKIDTSDRTKRTKNSANKLKNDKDGRTRRNAAGKRTVEEPIGRHSRQERGAPSTEGDGTVNGEGNASSLSADAENPTATEDTTSGRRMRGGVGGQRQVNTRRVGVGRTGTTLQTRGPGNGGLRGGGQRSLTSTGRSNAGGGANRARGGNHLPPSAEIPAKIAGETLPVTDNQQNGAINGSLADRSTQLKSPVISDGGQEEWETASESSDFGRNDDQPKLGARNSAERETIRKPNGSLVTNGSRAGANRRFNPSSGDFPDGGGGPLEASRPSYTQLKTAGQKNVKPASHTFQSNADSANKNNNRKNNNINNNNNDNNIKNNKRSADGNSRGALRTTAAPSQEKIARDDRKGAPSFPVHDGLAGVDINDASVVVIDYHTDLYNINNDAGSSESAAGDFEEVLSKKAKRQRLQQLEAERRRLEREKERQDKLQAKRTKQLQRRAERSAAKKATENKKEAPSNDRITVFTNQNYLDIGVDVFSQTADEKTKETIEINVKPVAETFLPRQSKTSPGGTNIGVISTGLDDITMTTVWNSTLAGVSSTDESAGSAHPTVAAAAIESLTKSVIPSPIARPPPKNAPRPLNWSADGLTARNKTLETAEKFDFTFDPSLKGSLKGSSVDGGLDCAEQPPLAAKSRYDSLRRSCSPGRGVASADASVVINGGLSVLADLKANSSSLIENSDHAQLQKKLDRVKDFWPGALSSNSFTSANDVVGDVSAASGRLNVAKVKPQSVSSSNTSTSTSAGVGAAQQINPLSPIGNKPLGTGFSGDNISLADYNSINGFVSMSSANSQSPSAAFGVSTGLQTIPPYQIMFRNGEFLTQPAFAHSASSPPTQNMIGQPTGGIIGTQQRSSRSNSFIEHTLIMTQQPNGVPSTPWSTGGGFEFLNGFNATPPPPISASTPGSNVGRSSIPPMAVPSPIGSVIGHHPYAAPPPPPPQIAMVGQPPNGKITTGHVTPVNYAAMSVDYSGVSDPMINFASHHPHAMPPPQMAHNLSHPPRMTPAAAGNVFGRGKPAALVNGVPPPSMSVPPLPAHFPPPYFPPPPSLRLTHIPPPPHPGQHPPPPAAVSWSKQPMKHNAFPSAFRPDQPIDRYRAANSFEAVGVPHDFSAPPPSLNGATFVGAGLTYGGDYRTVHAGVRNGVSEKVFFRQTAELKPSGGKNGAERASDPSGKLAVKPLADAKAPTEVCAQD